MGRKHPRAGGQYWEDNDAGGVRWVGKYPPPYVHPPDQKHRWPVAVGFSQQEVKEVENLLLLLAATLAGLPSTATVPASSILRRLVDTRAEGGVLSAGELLLAPAFMSADAEAQVEAALWAAQ